MSRFTYAAVAAVSVVVVNSYSATAQEPPTPGGDVTADQAAVLPPVVVQSPNEAIAQRTRPKRNLPTVKAKSSGTATATTAEASGKSEGGKSRRAVNVRCRKRRPSDRRRHLYARPARHDRRHHHRQRGDVDVQQEHARSSGEHPARRHDANTGGSRNERDILVRGFDRLRVPLYHGRRAHLFAGRQPSRLQSLPDTGSLRDSGREGLRLGAQRPRRHGRRHQPRQPQADQGDRTGGPRRRHFRRRSRRSQPVERLRLWAEPGRRATTRRFSGTIVDQDHFNLSDDFTPGERVQTR